MGAVPPGVAALLGELAGASSTKSVTAGRERRDCLREGGMLCKLTPALIEGVKEVPPAVFLRPRASCVCVAVTGSEGLSLRGSLRSSVNSFARVPQVQSPRGANPGGMFWGQGASSPCTSVSRALLQSRRQPGSIRTIQNAPGLLQVRGSVELIECRRVARHCGSADVSLLKPGGSPW